MSAQPSTGSPATLTAQRLPDGSFAVGHVGLGPATPADPAHVLLVKQRLRDGVALGKTVLQACQEAGLSRWTVWRYAKVDDELAAILEERNELRMMDARMTLDDVRERPAAYNEPLRTPSWMTGIIWSMKDADRSLLAPALNVNITNNIQVNEWQAAAEAYHQRIADVTPGVIEADPEHDGA